MLSGEFDFFTSGSGTTCDNILSQTMGQISAVDQLPPPGEALEAGALRPSYQRSTPTLQGHAVESEPSIHKQMRNASVFVVNVTSTNFELCFILFNFVLIEQYLI